MDSFPEYGDIEDGLMLHLQQLGSPTKPKNVYEPLADYFDLDQSLRQELRSDKDEPRWNNMVQWARRKLVERGLMERHPRAVWQLTASGRSAAARIAYELETSAFLQNSNAVDQERIARSAIDDLDVEAIGNSEPERLLLVSFPFVRDEAVRQRVIDRADGKCEFCRTTGFMRLDGTCYIESHHIISLAQQGPDTLDNVIALCANHHREAHFGADRIQLEREFQNILTGLNCRK